MNTTNVDLTPDHFSIQMEALDFRAVEIIFTEEGAPLDLTGLSLTIAGPTWITVTVADAVAGKVLLSLKPTIRESAAFEIHATNGTGDSRVFLTGNVDSK